MIRRPMDFGTVKKRLEGGEKYGDAVEVLWDVRLVFDNCRQYNNPGDPIVEIMEGVEKVWEKEWKAEGELALLPTPNPQPPTAVGMVGSWLSGFEGGGEGLPVAGVPLRRGKFKKMKGKKKEEVMEEMREEAMAVEGSVRSRKISLSDIVGVRGEEGREGEVKKKKKMKKRLGQGGGGVEGEGEKYSSEKTTPEGTLEREKTVSK